MPTTTDTPPSQMETNMIKGLDTLTECPECRYGIYTLIIYRENGRVRVACGICERARDFANTRTPRSQLETNMVKGLEALTECPECQIGNYTQFVLREDGQVKVECCICDRTRDFADAHTPPA